MFALFTVALLGACSDDSPGDESPDPAGTGVVDNPEGVTDNAATIVDPDVPASNVPNEPEAPLDQPADT